MNQVIQFILNVVTGDFKAYKKWVSAAIGAVESYLETWVRSLFQDVSDVLESDAQSIQALDRYVVEITNAFNLFTGITFPAFATDVQIDFAVETQNINSVRSWAGSEFTRIELAIIADILKLTEWVLSAVFGPLSADIAQIFRWIATDGAFMLNLLTHPDLLLKLLGHWLWDSFLDLLKVYSSPIANWLLHAMLGEAGTFADVLETILSYMI